MQKNGLVVTRDGRRIHYKDGLLHRVDGPAVTLSTGEIRFFLDGCEVEEKDLADMVQTQVLDA